MKEVVDECLLICQVRTTILVTWLSRSFESMGIDVSVNLNAFNFASLGNKRVREVGGLSVVTFSTTYKFIYKRVVFAKRLLDIAGALILLISWTSKDGVWSPPLSVKWRPTFFVQKRGVGSEKERTVFQLL